MILKKIRKFNKHSYHIVNPSPWPIIFSFGLLFLTFGIVMFFHNYNNSLILILFGLLILFLTFYTWFRDIIRESLFEGNHTINVQKNLKNGMLLFIFSELLFFISFFWAFFHSSLSPVFEIGSIWPPIGIKNIDFLDIPLLNTIILLTSGVTITWAHYSINNNDRINVIISLTITILLAFFFLMIQYFEYIENSFSISDSIYGTTFFLLTGFHGLHVIIGTIFIIIITFRIINKHFSIKHHLGFEAMVWYWHFVDVIWLFLFIIIYWWGNN